jgi:DNA-binding HxlR family transcriptional regulator
MQPTIVDLVAICNCVAICNYVHMKVSDFPRDTCSVANALEIIGDRWAIHVLRESFLGVTRFEQFRRNIGVAKNILSHRLNTLVAGGVLERRLYSERPPRYEYRLTEKGLDLYSVLIELMRWGNKWTPSPYGPGVILEHRGCGKTIEPALACPECGEIVRPQDIRARPGPGALAREAAS